MRRNFLKKQYVFLISIVLVVLAGAWWSSGAYTTDVVDNTSPSSADEVRSPAVENVAVSSSTTSSENSTAVQTARLNPMADPVVAEEVKGWFASRGNFNFYGPDFLSDYRAYDMDTLLRLGETGDLKAIHVTAERMDNFKDRKGMLRKAAFYGSTAALIEIGAMNEDEDGDLNSLEPEQRQAKVIEAFAYYEAAKMRGDSWGLIANVPSFEQRYKIELSTEDRRKIADRAKLIYDDLQSQRIQRGLGEFDNSVPDSVTKFYKSVQDAN